MNWGRVPRTPAEVVNDLSSELLLQTDLEILVLDCLQKLGWPAPSELVVEVGPARVGSTRLTEDGDTVYPITVPILRGAPHFVEMRDPSVQISGCSFHVHGEAGSCTVEGVVSAGQAPSQGELVLRVRAFGEFAARRAALAQKALRDRHQRAGDDLRPLVRARIVAEELVAGALHELGIALQAESSDRQVIPLARTGIDLNSAMEQAARGVAEPTLDENIRQQILQQIARFGAALERLPRTAAHLSTMGEEQLRDVLLYIINSTWHIANGEAFSGDGKTDIQLQVNSRVAFTAELKLYSGPKAIRSAIDQLTSYLVWRDTHAALVVIIRHRRDVSAVIKKVHEAVESHDRCVSTAQAGRSGAPRYLLSTADANRTVVLEVVTVPL